MFKVQTLAIAGQQRVQRLLIVVGFQRINFYVIQWFAGNDYNVVEVTYRYNIGKFAIGQSLCGIARPKITCTDIYLLSYKIQINPVARLRFTIFSVMLPVLQQP